MAANESTARLLWDTLSQKSIESHHQLEHMSSTKKKKKKKLVRGTSGDKMLTKMNIGATRREISKAQISSPIQSSGFPSQGRTEFILRGEVSPTTSTRGSPLLSPISFKAPVLRSATVPSSPEAAFNFPPRLARWNSAPASSVDASLLPTCEDAELQKWLESSGNYRFPIPQSPDTPDSTSASRSLLRRRGAVRKRSTTHGSPIASHLERKQVVNTITLPPKLPGPALPLTPPTTPEVPFLYGWPRGSSGSSVGSSVFGVDSCNLTPQSLGPRAASRLSRISEASFETELLKAQRVTQELAAIMETGRTSLQPPANTGTKLRAIQQAKETEKLVAERAKRTGDEPPPYEFFELIGKGAYGRVFKGCVSTSDFFAMYLDILTDNRQEKPQQRQSCCHQNY